MRIGCLYICMYAVLNNRNFASIFFVFSFRFYVLYFFKNKRFLISSVVMFLSKNFSCYSCSYHTTTWAAVSSSLTSAYIHASGFAASSRLLSEESPPTSARPPPVLTRPDYEIDMSVTTMNYYH